MTLDERVVLVEPMSSRSSRATRKTSPSRRLPLRALAALFVCFLASSSLGEIAHFLLVPHAICTEHGELLELHEAGDRAAAGAHDDDTEHGSGPDTGGESGREDGHDHCQLLARRDGEQATVAVPQLELILAAERPVSSLVQEPSVHPVGSLTLLLAAPKTSPPLFTPIG